MYMPTSGGYLLSGIYVGTVPCPFPIPLSDKSVRNTSNTSSNVTSIDHSHYNIDDQEQAIENDKNESE